MRKTRATQALQQRLHSLEETVKHQAEQLRFNGWSDLLSGFGDADRDPMARMEFAAGNRLHRRALEDLYQHGGVAASIVDIPADDATRKGVEIKSDDEAVGDVMGVMSEMPFKDGIHGRKRGALVAINRAMKLARLLGGAALIVSVRDGRMPFEALEPSSVDAVTRVHIHHAFELWPNTYGPDGSVETYRLAADADGSPTNKNHIVHASRVWPFTGVDLTPQRQSIRRGWGDPVLQRVQRALKHEGFVEEQAARITGRKNIPVFKTKGLQAQVKADGGKALSKRLRIMVAAMSILKMIPLDKDDDITHLDASLSGLPDLLDRFPYRTAAASRIPMTRLYGMSPGGMNATGESDIRLYYDTVMASIVMLDVVPAYRWLSELVMASSQGPTGGHVFDEWSVEACPLWEMTEKEKAETELIEAKRDKERIDSGVVLRDEVRKGLAGYTLNEEAFEAAQAGGDGEMTSLERVQQICMLYPTGVLHLVQETADPLRQALGLEPWTEKARDEWLAWRASGNPVPSEGEGGDETRNNARQHSKRRTFSKSAMSAQVGRIRLHGLTGGGSRLAIVIPIPEKVGEWIRTEPGKTPHITLAYIPDTQGRAEEASEVVRQVASEHGRAFRATLGGLQNLTTPEGKLVFYQDVDFRRWHHPYDLRDELVYALQAAGFGVSFPDEWIPHITLSVEDDPRAAFVGGLAQGSWFVSGLEVWGLPEMATHPLGI